MWVYIKLRLRVSLFCILNIPLLLGCLEDDNWFGVNTKILKKANEEWTCAHYKRWGWCEHGGVGGNWTFGENWPTGRDPYDGDARDVCCVCGGRGKGNPLSWNLWQPIYI